MVLRDCQANLSVSLESAVLVHEDDIWWFEWILIGKQYLTVVKPLMKLCVLGSLKGEMPSIQIVLQWCCGEVRKFLLG